MIGQRARHHDVCSGSWLCENARSLYRNRRSHLSKTVSGIQFESTFDLEIELKNLILVAFRFFAFLHSQGQKRKSALVTAVSAFLPLATTERTSREVRFVRAFFVCVMPWISNYWTEA
jgi:hypothetical protein